MPHYDYLIVGSGLYGATFAWRAMQAGGRVLVLDRRNHSGGNLYCENADGITVHKYGAHIFHTSNREVWDFVNRFTEFEPYINSPVANYHGELYNLPFNMNTFHRLWGVATPAEAMEHIEQQRRETGIEEPRNLEEQALMLVGRDIYEKLIKGYTEKQWGRPCTELPSFIIRRLPVRFTFDNNYFNDIWQGIPRGGYNTLIDRLLEGADLHLNTDFMTDRRHWESQADRILLTGRIDEYFDYRFGRLDYRGLRFENERLDTDNYQGVAVMNFTDRETPYTRIIEHRHFERGVTAPHTIVSREYPLPSGDGDEAYYPVNDSRNDELYARYASEASHLENIRFSGRLGDYKYYDMDKIVEKALSAEIF